MSWWIVLLLKPIFAVFVAVAYYFTVYRGSLFIGRFIKNRRLYDFLFRERGRDGGADSHRELRKNFRH